jgi:lactoylglutathione lyase
MEKMMKRFHVHVHVQDLGKNIAFYSAMFGQEPARKEADYAKWMLTDPPVNFAISTRGTTPGVDHLGVQVETQEELASMKANATKADMALLDEGETTCCYARSDKYWVTDPQGIAWEQFHTLDSVPVFGRPAAFKAASESACCEPRSQPPGQPARACCG